MKSETFRTDRESRLVLGLQQVYYGVSSIEREIELKAGRSLVSVIQTPAAAFSARKYKESRNSIFTCLNYNESMVGLCH